jgi:hypothetical protein
MISTANVRVSLNSSVHVAPIATTTVPPPPYLNSRPTSSAVDAAVVDSRPKSLNYLSKSALLF